MPNDFAPAQKSYPLLIVSATADGAASSIASAHRFLDDAIAKGFVVLAVDGEFGKPPENDSPPFRWALVSAGLEALRREWPEAKNWPIATGGVSGGGGYASHQFLRLAHDHARLIGLFLSVSHWSPIDFPDDFKQAPFSALRDVPIFLSAGEHDQIAAQAITDASHAALVQKGFKQVRYEHFAGGHELNHPHLQAALDWFLEQEKH